MASTNTSYKINKSTFLFFTEVSFRLAFTMKGFFFLVAFVLANIYSCCKFLFLKGLWLNYFMF